MTFTNMHVEIFRIQLANMLMNPVPITLHPRWDPRIDSIHYLDCPFNWITGLYSLTQELQPCRTHDILVPVFFHFSKFLRISSTDPP